MQRLRILLLLIPFVILTACSDDQANGADVAGQSQATGSPASESPGVVEGTVVIDFTGAPEELERVETAFAVNAGSSAWDALVDALGEENIQGQDAGGGLGIFVSGFYGVEAQGNHFWEFRINGEGATVGVSSYEVAAGDVLEFVYSSF